MITVYSKSHCPHCANASSLLDRFDIEYKLIKIDEDVEARDFLVSSGFKAVPQVFVGITHLGGWSELAGMTREEILDKDK